MNPGSVILQKQNEDESITLLAGQKELYTKAKTVATISLVMCLGIPLMFVLVQIFISVPYEVLFASSLITLVTDIVLVRRKSELQKEAASVQQAFDAHVYGIHFESASFNRKRMLQCAKELMNCKGERERLKSWYPSTIAGMDPGAAISECQHVNARWSKRLLTRYLAATIAASVAIVAIIAGVMCCRHVAWQSLFFLLPLLEWMIRQFYDIYRARQSKRGLEKALETFKLADLENIKCVQEKLYEARANDVMVPDKLYNMFREKDERDVIA
ncbi:S-4TM family putative pore-forming effector [Adlercreutzia caecimuris]|uniref:S-4TM family putative pore-forming effector n=1 Tax=Adlercreutzia caecimuris TaxID=671266 RepID=UPI00272C2395|nr:S-4TM family putative pore-forming effector [Adlercreutzia caecimuris]